MKNKISVVILTLGGMGLGIYGLFPLANSDLIKAWGEPGRSFVCGIELSLSIIAIPVIGFLGWLFWGDSLSERAEKSIRQKLIAEKVAARIGENPQIFFNLNDEEYSIIQKLASIPDKKWPRNLKRLVVDHCSELTQEQKTAIVTAVRQANNADLTNNNKLLWAKRIAESFPFFIPFLVLGASAYGMHKTAQLDIGKYAVPAVIGEILLALIVSLVFYVFYDLYSIDDRLVDYTKESIKESAIITAVNEVMQHYIPAFVDELPVISNEAKQSGEIGSQRLSYV